jgi:hypothetical protein
VAILKYAKVLVLAPAIGSALIGIAGLIFGVVLITGHRHSSSLALGRISVPGGITSQHTAAGEVSETRSQSHPQARPVERSSVNQPAKQFEARLIFTKLITKTQLAFLNDYAGRAVDNADGKQKVKTLVGIVAPYTPYHYGADFPLPQVISTLLLNEPQPIEIRDGRYAIITGFRNAIHTRRGLLWIDMRERVALGAIFFDPSNGEPSPTLTIFSQQLDRRSVRMSQLPRAFAEDLRRWAATGGIPAIMTRYFIGAMGEKTVLAHDENFCARAEGQAGLPDKSVCREMNAKATLIDTTAARFMNQTHNASNATVRMIASK